MIAVDASNVESIPLTTEGEIPRESTNTQLAIFEDEGFKIFVQGQMPKVFGVSQHLSDTLLQDQPVYEAAVAPN